VCLIGTLAFTLFHIRDDVLAARASCCKPVVNTTLASLLGLMVFFSIFIMFGYQWTLAYQLGFFSLIGIYALSVKTKPFLILYAVLAVFNTLCLLGQFAIFGYTTAAFNITQSGCLSYFGPDVPNSRCDGYMGLLRVIGLFSVLAQSLVAFLWFILYFDDQHHTFHSRIENERKGFEPEHGPSSAYVPVATPTPAATIYQPSFQTYQQPPISTSPTSAGHQNYSEI
jgi:hypothetical protein